MGMEGNVPHQHHIVIAIDFFEDFGENFGGIFIIATEQLFIGFDNPFGCIEQAFAAGVFPRPLQQHLDGGLRLFARGTGERGTGTLIV